jgi:hypothetical protein
MRKIIGSKAPLRALKVALLATSLLAGAPALAQLTTATVRGNLSAGDAVAAGATVSAVNIETSETRTATAGANGGYSLTGLRPGTYDLTVTTAAGQTLRRRVTVSVGQTATLDADVAAGTTTADDMPAGDPEVTTSAGGEEIVVTGVRLVETKTSEVATNISQDQIENLPQNNRNFLNFAALAPGIKVLQTEFRQTFGGAGVGLDRNGEALGGPQINVFIDGVSLKSNLQQGGVVGQDVSRGNPFSQLAVQEFRVLTSNFKAEYEDAGTSIITAITKSGTNEFHGEAFGTYQDESLVSRDFLQKRDNLDKPELERIQFGAALGGPIIKDSLFFFANYEANFQDRVLTVVPGGSAADQALLPFDVNEFRGSFASPFREHLGFAKLTWQISPEQLLEVTGSLRMETDVRDFGGQTALSRGSNVDNDVYTGKIRHLWEGEGFVNELTADYLKSDLTFGADFDAGFGRTFEGIIAVGGRADFQEAEQESFTFRNNFSLTDVEWNGNHLIKVGGRLSLQKFRVGGSGPNANPQFSFRRDAAQGLDFSFPELVRFGGGDPEYADETVQFGLFAQDDWALNEKLTLNLGLRWDVDTKSRNNDFVTSDRAAQALRALGADPRIGDFFDVEDYISTGENRDVDYDNFAPRIGFSYDLFANQRTVIFGGYGRYYDRTLYRNAAEESLLTQYRSGELLFSRDGQPRNGRPTIAFRPEYLTEAGFAALLASLSADPTSPGTNELRVVPNNLETPYTDQFSVGVRQRFGPLRTSLTYNYTVGKDQVGYAPLNRSGTTNAGGFYDFIPLINGYGNAVAAFNTRASRYHGIFVQIDKPYSQSSGYGFGIAYTLAFSKERGFGFNFDFPNISERPFVPNFGDERHRLVVNGIVDLPLDFRLSGLATIGSGTPFFIIDARQGFGARDILFPGNVGTNPAFVQVDLKLQKNIRIFNGGEFQIWGEVFNLFNRANVGRRDSFVCCGNELDNTPDALFGPPRSFQFGAAFRF